MQIKRIFTIKKKYATIPTEKAKQDIPEGLVVKCLQCSKIFYEKEWKNNLHVCPSCGAHHKMTAMERINSIVDDGSFEEWDANLETNNPLDFPDYEKKLKMDQKKTGLKDAVVSGKGKINQIETALVVMDPFFRMASMGAVVGEKITRALERAKEEQLPIIIFTASGGARMQEGMISLMQMAKTSMAVERFDQAGGCMIVVMTNPTTGGVTASFASIGDYHFAEPHALIGFAGRRIIEQTIREQLPEDFQTAEFQLEHGQIDRIVKRSELKQILTTVLDLHQSGGF
ncbi:acetyl-CoA carboxylase, carboxyltransferase subunit beta [Amphibacillus sp. MSJ-3]|uniref:acetyl-CoA carboxylase, carboxyltransferase subunit beta n=1 Tax=Amphibacillus sp. MSJ-3 TaxID=2841505 RepID=UPI001C0F37E5|nr:acetyl-CoA carboxylase, carboxyltransferase subunit beta [Amphibacillus sp. MSJ-3]MBU5593666.1 acetyl-CoA carboxylase, carboxyltransferase subunit beta [Amphibacillus sp. MSJ-3]